MTDSIDLWLDKLGLSQYAEAFAENGVNVELLPEITNEDLKDLGVSRLADRKRILKAISESEGEPVSVAPGNLAKTSTQLSASLAAERRQLTVMFVDLVGSTALSGELDPEEMRDAITTYQNTVAGVVTRFDGHVAKYMGDGVLCYFGWPSAHEDDAERAVRAGLSIVQALQGLKASNGSALIVRTGIATGLVVVGDLVGEGAAQEEAVVGETPNLAARLQGLADPGQVVLSESTRRLLGNTFHFSDLGQQNLKGIKKATKAFAVGRERFLETRFSARQARGLGLLVGRDQELALLNDRWNQAKGGEGQMVLLTGEAGVGKSRIARGLIDSLAGSDHVRVSYQCSPYHTDSALYPTIQQLSLAADFDVDDTAEVKLDKLEVLLKRGSRDISIATPLFASLLGLGEFAEARYGTLDYSPQQRRALTLETLLDQLIGLAGHSPVLFIVEDAHWIDPTTLELIELSLDRVENQRVMLLVTARPTFEYAFGGHPIVTRLALNKLGREQISHIVNQLTNDKSLPDEVLELIATKTDGVPLFVEEFTKTLLESEFLKEAADSFELIGPLQDLSVPTSLHDSLMARLDRLKSIKEVAQMAACIGRQFDYVTLHAISSLGEDELRESLEQLRDAELLFRRGVPPEAQYTFKHALVRDAAYESLLKSKRKEVHAAIVSAFESHEATGTETDPALLAIHATEADLPDKAVSYWHRAGQQAIESSANIEAIANLSRGLEILRTLPADKERLQRELELQTMLAGPLITTKGYGAKETGEVFTRALELSEQVDDPALLFPVLYQQWVYDLIGSRTVDARQRAEQFLRLAEQFALTGPKLLGHRILAVSLYYQGEFLRARDEFQIALELYRDEEHKDLAFHFGQDAKAACLSFLSIVTLVLGYPDEASRIAEEAIEHAKKCRHANTLAYALFFGPMKVAYCSRNMTANQTYSNALLGLALDQGLAMWLAYATVHNGWLISKVEVGGEALEKTLKGIEDLRSTNTALDQALELAQLAEVYAVNQQFAEGICTVDRALEIVNRTGERWYEAELHRLKADIILNTDSASAAEEAEKYYQKAIYIAQSAGAKYWELRASKNLAKLWSDQGELQKARDLLRPIYDWFSEGFDTPELVDANKLLHQLS